MKRLLLAGAGDFGREVYSWLRDIKTDFWQFAGFLDDNLASFKDIKIDAHVVGSISAYEPQADDVLVCCIGNSKLRNKIAQNLQKRGAQFINLIHPTALVGAYANLGVGNILGPYSYVANHAIMKDFVILNVYASVGHNCKVGNACTLSNHASLAGYVQLGDCVFMGSHACVIPKITINDEVIIGAGSAVMRNVKSVGITVVGAPAKQLI